MVLPVKDDTRKTFRAAFPHAPHDEALKLLISRLRRTRSGCWLYVWPRLNRTKPNCYSRLIVDGRPAFTHRLAYEWATGDDLGSRASTDATVDHTCRVRGCANPAHLERVSRAENTMRGESPHARNARKTECKRGHPLSGENLYLAAARRGTRRCKTCMRMWLEARRRRQGMNPSARPADRRRKLDAESAREIRRRLRNEDPDVLAGDYAVSIATIRNIAAGRTWANA